MSAVAPIFTSQPLLTTTPQGSERAVKALRITAIVSFVTLAVFLGLLFYATESPLALGAAIVSVLSGIAVLSTCHPRFPALINSIKRLFSRKQPGILREVGSKKPRLTTIPRSPAPQGEDPPLKGGPE